MDNEKDNLTQMPEAEAQPAPQPDDQGGGDVTPVTPEG